MKNNDSWLDVGLPQEINLLNRKCYNKSDSNMFGDKPMAVCLPSCLQPLNMTISVNEKADESLRHNDFVIST